jgi:hypothetical protein
VSKNAHRNSFAARYLQILRGISCKLENLSSEILKDSSRVNSSRSTNTSVSRRARLQETMDTTNRKLETSAGRARLNRLLLIRLHNNHELDDMKKKLRETEEIRSVRNKSNFEKKLEERRKKNER